MDRFTAKQRVTQLIAHNFIHVESTDDYVHTFNTLKNTVDNVEELLLDLIDKIYKEKEPSLCKRCLIAMARREEKLNDYQ